MASLGFVLFVLGLISAAGGNPDSQYPVGVGLVLILLSQWF